MADAAGDNDRTGAGRFDHLRAYALGGIQQQLAAGAHVDGGELAAALRRYGQRPIPPDVLDYLCRLLDGKVARPLGRKAAPAIDRHMQRMLVGGAYRQRLAYLTERKCRYGRPAGWTRLDCPPAEIAARMVARMLLSGEESWRTVQNISSRK